MDDYRRHVMGLQPGEVCIQAEISDSTNEVERYCKAFTEKHTDTIHMMALPVVNERDVSVTYGFYGTDRRKAFTRADKAVLSQVGPIVINATRTMMLYREFDFKLVAVEKLIEMEGIKALVFDERLNPVYVPGTTLRLLRDACGRPDQAGVPEPILNWIRTVIAPEGKLTKATGPCA